MHNQTKHSIFGYDSPLITIATGFLTLLIANFPTHPHQSIAADHNDNPRGDFPGRLEGGGSRNTESIVDYSPQEQLDKDHEEINYIG